MDIYEPRKRIALDIESIQDSEVKAILTNLSELQKEVQTLNNGLGTQVEAGIQEAQAMIEKMTKVNQDFDQMLDSIKSQVQQLTNAALQYVQMNNAGLQDDQPKFRDSFVYITKQAASNIQKLVDGIKTQVGDVLQVVADSSPIEMDMQPEEEAAVDMTPENLLTSSINAAKEVFKKRIAALLPAVMKTVEKIEPIVNQANNVSENTEKLVQQLQDVIGTIPQTEEPVVEETEAYNPDISSEEVEEAAGLEEDMGLDSDEPTEEGMAAPIEEVAPAAEEEAAPAPAEEEAEEETPAADEEAGEPAPEAAEETEEVIEEPEEEAIIEDEPAKPVEPAAEKEE